MLLQLQHVEPSPSPSLSSQQIKFWCKRLWVCLPYPPVAAQSISLVQPQPPWVVFPIPSSLWAKRRGTR